MLTSVRLRRAVLLELGPGDAGATNYLDSIVCFFTASAALKSAIVELCALSGAVRVIT